MDTSSQDLYSLQETPFSQRFRSHVAMLSRLRRRQSKAILIDNPEDGAAPTGARKSATVRDSNAQAHENDDRAAKAPASYSTLGLFTGGPRRPSLRTMQSESMLPIRRPFSLPATNESKPRRSRSAKGSDEQATTIGTPYSDTSAEFPFPIPVTIRPRTAGVSSRVAGIDIPTHRTTSSGSLRPSTSRTSFRSSVAPSDRTSPILPRGSLPRASDVRFGMFNRDSNTEQEVRPKTPRLEVGLASPRNSRARLRLEEKPRTQGMGLNDDPKGSLDAASRADMAHADTELILARPSSLEQPKFKSSQVNPEAGGDGEAHKSNEERIIEAGKKSTQVERKEARGRQLIAPLKSRGTLARRRRGISVSSIQTVDTNILARTPTAEKFQFEADLQQEPLPLKSSIHFEHTNDIESSDILNTPALLSAFPQPNSTRLSRSELLVPDTPTLVSNFAPPSSKQLPTTFIVPPRNDPGVPDTPALISSFPAPRITATKEDRPIAPRTSPRPSENPSLRSSIITRPVPSQNFGWLDLGIVIDQSESGLEDAVEEEAEGLGR